MPHYQGGWCGIFAAIPAPISRIGGNLNHRNFQFYQVSMINFIALNNG